MKSPNHTLTYRLTHNARPCEVSGCGTARYGVSNYCRAHRSANRAHGHPLGIRVWPRDYAQERKEVLRLLRDRPEYPGLRAGLVYLQTLLARGSALGCDEFARLAGHGVTARRLLEELASVTMFAHRQPHRLPDDARLTFALATAALHLAPRIRKLGTTEPRYRDATRETRRAIGEAIRRNLGVLLHNLATEPDRMARLPGAAVQLPATTILTTP